MYYIYTEYTYILCELYMHRYCVIISTTVVLFSMRLEMKGIEYGVCLYDKLSH